MLCRASRKAQKITLTELSNKIGYSPASLSRFERGTFNLDYVGAYSQNVLNAAERCTLNELYKEVNEDGR